MQKMQLFPLRASDVPPASDVIALPCHDGVHLRFAHWRFPSAQSSPKGTIIVLQGRGEFIEKYLETIAELLERQFDVISFDWRGQGLSTRFVRPRYKGHIDDFSLYFRDLEAVEVELHYRRCPKPWFVLAHSMGAAIILAQATRNPWSERIVAIAPLIGLYGLAHERRDRFLANILNFCGFGGMLIPRGSRVPDFMDKFVSNKLTSDPIRYQRMQALVEKTPQLATGSPTIGWIHAAFEFMDLLQSFDFAAAIETSFLTIVEGNDTIIDNRATELFVARSRVGRLVPIAHARHEILMERDYFRQQFWAAFDAYIPGNVEEQDAVNSLISLH